MPGKISQAGTIINFKDLCSGLKGIFADQQQEFIKGLERYFPAEYVFLMNSGSASLYIILRVLREFSSANEVVLPVCTASSVILPIAQLGLKPVLCDISGDNFNMDLNLLPGIINKNTLAVVPAHIFGTAVSGIENLKETFKDVFIIEDCAQAMGSKIDGKNLGTFGDISFVSFNRGKNLPTYGGGCIFTDSKELAAKIKNEIDKLKIQNKYYSVLYLCKIAALSVVMKPCIYGAFYNIISKFKNTEVPEGFSVAKYTGSQAGVGLSLLKNMENTSNKRHENAVVLIKALNSIKNLKVPKIPDKAIYAFNRFPIIIEDKNSLLKAKERLFGKGIDVAPVYILPLHHLFDLNYKKEDFPNGNFLTEHLLTLPIHPLVKKNDLEKMINVIKKAVE